MQHTMTEEEIKGIVDDGEEYFTSEQSAAFLGKSLAWFIRRIVPDNNLEGFQRFGGREVYYKKSQLEPLLKMRPRQKKEGSE